MVKSFFTLKSDQKLFGTKSDHKMFMWFFILFCSFNDINAKRARTSRFNSSSWGFIEKKKSFSNDKKKKKEKKWNLEYSSCPQMEKRYYNKFCDKDNKNLPAVSNMSSNAKKEM